jgi:hypothetical protein
MQAAARPGRRRARDRARQLACAGARGRSPARSRRSPTPHLDLRAGRPALIGYRGDGERRRPGDMTRAIAFNESYTDRRTPCSTPVEAAEQRLAEREASAVEKYQGLRSRRTVPRPPPNLHTKQTLEQRCRAQTAQVKRWCRGSQCSAASAASRIARHDRAILAQLKKQERKIRRRSCSPSAPARRSPRARRRPRQPWRLPRLPGQRPDHLAVRLPRSPDLPLLGPARRRRLRRPCGAPMYAVAAAR